MTAFTHLLVDLDGTLVKSQDFSVRVEFSRKLLRDFAKARGWFRAFRAFRATTQSVFTGDPKLTNDQRSVAAFAQAMEMPEDQARELLSRSVRECFPTLEPYFYPVPGAPEFVKWASGKFALTLATNPVWPEDIVRLRLSWADVQPALFPSVTHSQRMHYTKPKVEFYSELVEQEQLEPSRCLMIGDDFRKDLPATKIGIAVFIVREKSKIITPVSTGKGDARAFSGNFSQLRRWLEDGQFARPGADATQKI